MVGWLRSVTAYAGGSLVTGVVWLVILPYVTATLSPGDIGVFGAYRAGYQLLLPMMTLGAGALVMWSHLEEPSPTRSNASASIAVSTTFALALIPWAFLARPFLDSVGLPSWTPFAVIATAWMFGFGTIAESVYQMEERPVGFLGQRLVDPIVFLTFALLLLNTQSPNWSALVSAQSLGVGALAVVAAIALMRRRLLSLAHIRDGLVRVLGFGARFIPHAVGLWAANYADRYLISAMVGVDVSGLYVVAYSVAMSFSALHEGVSRVFAPNLARAVGSRSQERLREASLFVYRYAFWASFLSLLAILPAMFAFTWLVADTFEEGARFLPWLIMGQAAFGVTRVLTGFLLVSDRVARRSWITVLTGLVNFGLSALLIVFLGADGAAVATLLSFLVGLALTAVEVRRLNLLPSLSAVGGPLEVVKPWSW